MTNSETWATVPGYPSYEVSSLGRMRRATATCYRPAGYVLKLTKHDGYLKACLSEQGTTKVVKVHHLVMLAFRGPTPEGMEIRHLDGNGYNPSLCNLAFGTHVQNCEDRKRHGRDLAGSKSPRAILTEQTVLDIRRRHKGGESATSLAVSFGVSRACALNILHRRTWKHI